MYLFLNWNQSVSKYILQPNKCIMGCKLPGLFFLLKLARLHVFRGSLIFVFWMSLDITYLMAGAIGLLSKCIEWFLQMFFQRKLLLILPWSNRALCGCSVGLGFSLNCRRCLGGRVGEREGWRRPSTKKIGDTVLPSSSSQLCCICRKWKRVRPLRVCVCVLSWSVGSDPFSTPMDCSLLGSFVHGIFQATVLEWTAIFCSRGSSWPHLCISYVS